MDTLETYCFHCMARRTCKSTGMQEIDGVMCNLWVCQECRKTVLVEKGVQKKGETG